MVVAGVVAVGALALFVASMSGVRPWLSQGPGNSAPLTFSREHPARSEEVGLPPIQRRSVDGGVGTGSTEGRGASKNALTQRFEVERSTVASSAVEIGQNVLERYEQAACWELVFSELLDLSGSAWGAILRSNDGARVSLILALPEVMGRSSGADNPTVVTELIIDVERENRSMRE